MELEAVTLIALSGLALFASIGGMISYHKNRQPLEGVFLGAVLGPIGLILVARRPYAHRPMVDQNGWHSFQTLVGYQTDNDRSVLQLPAPGQSVSERHAESAA